MKMPNQKVRSLLMQILNRVDIEQILWISFSPDNNKRSNNLFLCISILFQLWK